MKTLKLNKEIAYSLAKSAFSTATDLAEYLSSKGVAFRDSHHIVGSVVKFCEDNNTSMHQLTIKEFHKFSKLIKDDVYDYISVEHSVGSRKNVGSTAPKNVLKNAKHVLTSLKKNNRKK